MYRYRNNDMAELGHQLTLSPRHLRPRQIEGLEQALDLIQPDETYPYEWVCFHITGKRLSGRTDRVAISGQDLWVDLPTMAEHITRKGSPLLSDLPAEYYTYEDVSAVLKVSTKTVRRWRSRGLMGVRAIGEDEVTRLLFSRRSVERFRERNQALVERGASFTLLTEAEKTNIVDIARRSLTKRRQKLHVVAKSIAEETGRAVETVRYTLRQYDRANPDQALFSHDGEPVVSRRHLSIWRCYNKGETPAQMAKAFSCSVRSIRSILLEMQARILKDTPIEYMENELFDAPQADELILNVSRPAGDHSGPSRVRAPRDLPGYLRALYDTPLLSREQEADLFRRFNYLRFKAARAVRELDVYKVTQRQLDTIRETLDAAEALKCEIIQANLRLVVSIAKRHVGRSDNLFEVISDGNLSLIRAVEKFDFSLGNKFSTYGTWAIAKNFARSVPEEHYHMRKYVTGQDEMLAAAPTDRTEDVAAEDLQHVRSALGEGLSQLSDRERVIVERHFGLDEDKDNPSTLEDLGRRFGVTKERVRQIEKRAIEKLSEILSPSLLDAFAT